jgi:hypothetical protein
VCSGKTKRDAVTRKKKENLAKAKPNMRALLGSGSEEVPPPFARHSTAPLARSEDERVVVAEVEEQRSARLGDAPHKSVKSERTHAERETERERKRELERETLCTCVQKSQQEALLQKQPMHDWFLCK